MARKYKKALLLIFIFCLISNFNHSIYAQKEDIVTPSGLSRSGLYDSIESYVKEHTDTTAGLAISVFNDKDQLYLGNHGYADIENQVVVSEDTVFEWGSTSKLLIWVSVFQLWEKDRIDLNEDIRTYLPGNFLKKANKDEKITMLNLMHHDAGWQEVMAGLFVEDSKDIPSLKEALQKSEPEKIYPVGKYNSYSNWGSALAAYIVEEITGEKYSQYVIDNIFKPLNMNDTAILPDLSDNPGVREKRKEIKGYTSENEIISNDIVHIPLYPCGMVTGTINDLEKFGKALINYKGEENLFQNKQTISKLLGPTLYYEGTKYPLLANGFWFTELGVSVLGHGGNTKAFSSNLLIDPISKTCVITMTNQCYEEIYNNEMMPLIFGDFNPTQLSMSKSDMENVSGTYQITRTFLKGYGKLHSFIARVKVKNIDNNQLKLTWPGDSYNAYEFEPSLYDVEGSLFQFYKDKDDSTILSEAYGDSYKLKKSQIVIEYTVAFLGVLALLYCIIMLIFEFVAFFRYKKRNERHLGTSLSKYHLITLFEILFVFLNLFFMVQKLLNLDTLAKIRPHIYLSFIFMITLLGYPIFAIFALRKSDIKRRTKIKYILTSIASLFVSLNIFYWQLYLIR